MLVGAGLTMATLPGGMNAAAARGLDNAWAVDGLLVDGLVNPRGLHSASPRLSWQLTSNRRDARQSAWRVGVASSPAAAEAGRFDLWDSGRVDGETCFDVTYGGAPLTSRRQAWWRVTSWDDRGVAATSRIAHLEMGLLAPADWSAQWLSAETPTQRDDREAGLGWRQGALADKDEALGFRLRFTLPAAAEVALMSACDAYARIYLDGHLLIDPARNGWGVPGPWNVASSLPAGEHILAIETRGGGGTPVKAAALIRATLQDGRVLRITGERMRSAAKPVAGWREPDFPDRDWTVTTATGGASPMPAQSATLLRTQFRVSGRVASARLYTTALGLYEAEVNGRRLDDALLRPEFTDYRAHCLYGVDDVAEALVQGDNVLGLHVADGWYGSYISPNGRFSFGDAPLRVLAQLEVRYADGRTQIVGTGDGWMVSASPIVEATIYNGEHYDTGREQLGWSRAGFNPDARWSPAVSAPPASGALVAAVVPPIRRQERLRPVRITVLPNGASVVDFGQNFAGWSRLTAKGERGRTVSLRYAELLNADGSVDQTNLRAARATDAYTFRGDTEAETYEPRFTYHGFRYVQVEGLGRPLQVDDITGVPIRTDLRETSDLMLGSYVPQRLWINSRWSQRSNFMGIPTDCPQRDERLGWTGDAHVFWDAASFNMDTAAFTQRFLRDLRDAQRGAGDYPDIAPNANREKFNGPGSSPGWGDAGVALPWTIWQRYGDTAAIDQHWASMDRFMESIRASNPDLIWSRARGADYGDWLALDAVQPGDPTTPKDLVGTAMWKGAADQMAQMAHASGRQAEAGRYERMAADLARAFRRTFVKADGAIGNGSQTGYILALNFSLLESAQRPEAVRRLVADIRRRGTLLSTGFLGTPYSLDVLADAGEDKLVYDLLLRTEFPSWGYMIAKGATTTWERWNSDAGDRSMNSFNHYALGAVVGFMFRRIAGIAPTGPGFRKFTVKPVLDPRLPSAGATYQSRLGQISTNWRQKQGGRFSLELSVPVGSTATVHLPNAGGRRVMEGGVEIAGRFGAVSVDSSIILAVRSGRYTFDVA
ncbi:MAG: family 78 glycoside hydrolase catalytic domain [Sphingomonas phyllosphaerae]|uniref:alpha-L-rhamnosidase n=1 Tax=Sphingomonas phyllosphaerae TaxID=257003 RepID=UPI002FFC01E2